MFNLVQFLQKRAASSGIQPLKEKIAPQEIKGIAPVEQLGKVPEIKKIDEPVESLTSSITDKPLKKIAYARNTGLADCDGLPYTNIYDVLLLNKLGYTIDENSYLFLPRGQEKEGLYSYIEKNAGVPKIVTRAIDEGKAFSSEYLKDVDYSVPKGYEIKGDLCCPVEKTAFELNESSEKTSAASPAWQRSAGKNPEGGLNAKGRASYKRETGGTLKAPVTESNPSGDRAKRQNSFCSRMCGMKRVNTGAKAQGDPDSRINKSLRKWNCKCGEEHESLYSKIACVVKLANVDITNTNPSMSLSPGSLQVTHSPINIQASTQGQTTPVDNAAKTKALLAAGKSFATDQMIGAIPSMFGGAANIARGTFTAGRLANKIRTGANALESGGHIGAGELSARQADSPSTANLDRSLSYVSSALPLVTKNPLIGAMTYAGNTLYDAANAGNEYHKNIPSAPPSMGRVPEQKFNINLKEQPTPDFRLTQPRLREQPFSSSAIIAKQGMEKEAGKQPLLPGIRKWIKTQPFNHAEDAYKHGRIPKHVRDDVVSGRAAEKYRPKFKEMLDNLRKSSQNK